MKNKGITCGIHYDTLHENPLYGSTSKCEKSSILSKQTVSIPFHENLNDNKINHILETIINEGHINNS